MSVIIRQGRLKGAAKKKGKRWLYDPVKSKELIRQTRDPMNPSKILGEKKSHTADIIKEKKETIKKSGLPAMDYHTAKTLNERLKGALKKLEYDEKIGKLIDSEKVKLDAFNIARNVRDSIMNIPDRISARLTAETDIDNVRDILTDSLREALQALSDV